MVFTNGTMINDRVADRIIELGNVCPVHQHRGFAESTDARRGEGTYDRIMAAMDRLRERGAMASPSPARRTSQNIEEITSDEFADLMVEKGAFYGWYFLYMPVGRDPDLSLMPSAEQRIQLHAGVVHIRTNRPMLVADFWGDGPLTGGCLSGGRKYLHINNKGDVEPCIFAHFAVDNIKEKSLIDCLCSDFFKDLRRMAALRQEPAAAVPHHRPSDGAEDGGRAQRRVPHARRRESHCSTSCIPGCASTRPGAGGTRPGVGERDALGAPLARERPGLPAAQGPRRRCRRPGRRSRRAGTRESGRPQLEERSPRHGARG